MRSLRRIWLGRMVPAAMVAATRRTSAQFLSIRSVLPAPAREPSRTTNRKTLRPGTHSFSAARLSTMIEVHHDTLHFSFHDVHADAHFRLSFQRTLRIPDDNRSYPLPPGLGDFPLYRVDDHAARLPPAWREHGGVFLPGLRA